MSAKSTGSGYYLLFSEYWPGTIVTARFNANKLISVTHRRISKAYSPQAKVSPSCAYLPEAVA